MEFFETAGKKAIGSRLRMLTEKITEDAAMIYQLYDVDLQPKWFPVFYILSSGEEKTITSIAKEIGHSHPSVSKIISEMSKRGLVREKKDKTDGRRNMVSLSKKGKELTAKIEDQYTDIAKAIDQITEQTTHNLWEAIKEWEYILAQKSLFIRVKEQQKQRESMQVKIIDYTPEYKTAFKALNEEWISTYFTMEESDYKALDHPEEYILNKGGHIMVALYDNEVAGVCALIKMNDPEYDFELAKMAVSPKAQGKSIGWLLGQAILEKAKAAGGSNVYLESNTALKPAINLYRKLGFEKIAGRATPYARCDIQMGIKI